MPPVGEYNPNQYTINYEVRKKAKKNLINNALLTNIKNKKGFDIAAFDSKEKRFSEKKKNGLLVGPGTYPTKSDFDSEAIDTKPNMIISKVNRIIRLKDLGMI